MILAACIALSSNWPNASARQNGSERFGQPYGDNYFVVTPATNSISTAPNQNTNLSVVLTTTANYPGPDVIPNPAGSVAVYSWSNSSVAFTVNGLPWNCGAQFASASLNSAGTNVLNLIASNNAPVGSYLVTVEGNGSASS